jgi:hypothetical protein
MNACKYKWSAAKAPNPTVNSVHLQDATPEDLATIEAHLGLHFEFLPDSGVKWKAVS